jgi:hypothetical protein
MSSSASSTLANGGFRSVMLLPRVLFKYTTELRGGCDSRVVMGDS